VLESIYLKLIFSNAPLLPSMLQACFVLISDRCYKNIQKL